MSEHAGKHVAANVVGVAKAVKASAAIEVKTVFGLGVAVVPVVGRDTYVRFR